MTSTDRIIRRSKIQERTGLSISTIRNMEKAGRFPARIRISANSVGWRESDIARWLADRPRGLIPAAELNLHATA